VQTIPFEQFAGDEPASVCVIDCDEHVWTRADVLRAAMGIADAYRRSGLTQGDTVAIVAPNCAEYLAAYLAAVYAGLYFVPINRHLTPGEITYVIEDSGASLLIVHSSTQHVASTLGKPIASMCVGSTMWARKQDLWPFARSSVPGSVVFYTSATTGRPKGVRRPGYDTLESLRKVSNFHASLGIHEGPGEVHLCAGPLNAVGPFENSWVALNRGNRVVLVGKWEAEDFLRKVERYRVTTTFMVPTMFARLLRLPEAIREKYDHSSLKNVPHAGAPCPRHVKQRMLDWWGPIVFEGYGATEAVGTCVTPAEWVARPGTVGRPVPGADILILDENFQAVRSGVAGRVYIKPYSTAGFEYINDPVKTKACQHGEYVYVGDIGYLDDDGYLFLCDRQIDMIICGGVNVYSAEVEGTLLMHEAVLDCAVVGEPDDDLGERIVAFVQLARGFSPDDALRASLVDFVRSRLALYKTPRSLRFIEELPRDPNGKLLKRHLRQALTSEWRSEQHRHTDETCFPTKDS
jgi:long-chain acyl-CoA synthetase